MAEISTEKEVKTPETEVKKETTIAPEGDKPIEGEASDTIDEKDLANVVNLLNELDVYRGGKGDIKAIPPEIFKPIKFALEKMVTLRDAFKDPLFKPVLDDMVDQGEDGKTPSLLVAVARNVPIEDLQNLADSEDYEGVQGAIDDRLADESQAAADEEALFAGFEKSQKAGEEYAAEMNYDEDQKQKLFETAMAWFEVLGDGELTKEEWAKVDKMRNYDKDIEDMRSQIPQQPKKEVLPDKASIETAMESSPVQKKAEPRNSLESMATNAQMVDPTKIGSRRRFK